MTSNTSFSSNTATMHNGILEPYVSEVKGRQLLTDILREGASRGLMPGRTVTARKWFRESAKRLSNVDERELMMSEMARYRSTVYPGRMYMFYYDPKYKETLPYYDRFPLIFPIEPYRDGSFLAINLHYLPHVLRAKLMDALYTTLNNTNYDQTTRLQLSYQILKQTTRMREFKPCIKKYLMKHVRSRFVNIAATEWDIALFLPTERFEKASSSQVWSDSRRIISRSGRQGTKRRG